MNHEDLVAPAASSGSLRSACSIAVIALGSWLGWSPDARAHGQLDQSYPTTPSSELGTCPLGPVSVFQSFSPSASPLVALDLYPFAVGTKTVQARVRQGSPTGAVLATASATVTFVTSPQKVHFDLPAPLAVTPGGTYVLELVGSAPQLGYAFSDPGSYPGGHGFGCTALPAPSFDYHFATYTAATGGCVASDTTLCLHGNRFRVEANWRTPEGQTGAAHAVPLPSDAGYFWFFQPTNAELFVKVKDACVAPYNRYWFFAAGLTNVRVELVVTDTQAGQSKPYVNPLNRPFRAIQDTQAFATCP